jgi:outer membrane receptor protein involved in Fe transport
MWRWKAWLSALALASAAASAVAQTPAPPSTTSATAPARPPAKPAPAKAKAAEAKTVEGLTVTAGTPDVQTSIDRKSYTLGKDLQASTGSIADALRNLPSVEVDVQGNLSLRGDPSVTILVDGKPSPAFEGKGRADALQQLPADQIERVEVITNPSAALNPEGTGGVINLITKKSRGAGWTGSTYLTAGSSSVRRAGATLGYNSPKLSATAAVSGNYQRNKQAGHDVRSALDPVSGQFLDSVDDFIGRNIQRGPAGRISLSYAPDAKDQLTAGASYNELLSYGHPIDRYFNLDAAGQVASFNVRQGHRRFEEIDASLTGGWKHTFAEGHTLSLDLIANSGRPRDHVTYTTVAAFPPPTFTVEPTRDDATQKHTEARLAYLRPLAGGTLTTGYEWKHDDHEYDYSVARGTSEANAVPAPALANAFSYRQTINTGYATYEHAFGDLGAQVGLRLEEVRFDLDQHTSSQTVSQDYVKAYPSLHLSWKLDDERKITASLSHRVQRPPSVLLNPLIYVRDPQNIQAGNPDLKPQDTHSYELGFEQHSGSQTYIATLFYRRNVNEFSQALVDLGDGVFESTFLNSGSSQAVGLELTANGKLTRTLSYNASATPYWAAVDSGNPQFGGERSVVTANGRASLNWQADADDLLQLNANGRGRIITAQGFLPPVWTLNFGWRRKLTDRINLTFTAQDLLATNRFERTLSTPTLRDHLLVEPVSRSFLIRLDYRFGGGKQRAREPGFEYENGGPPSP